MNARERKGLEIAARLRITFQGDSWKVPSQTTKAFYTVVFGPECSCTCDDFNLRAEWCKHIYAVKFLLEREHGVEPVQPEEEKPKPRKPTYKQEWSAYNAAQTNEKDLFQVLLHDLCRRLPTPAPGKKGGRPKLPLSDMVFAVAFKVYCTFSARRFESDLRDAKGKGYISKVPHFNSILNYLAEENMSETLTELVGASAVPLKGVEEKFASDSSGFSTCRFVRWFDEKYGREVEQHHWVTAHIMCGVKTNVVTAVEITEPHVNDSPRFPGLLKDTAKRFKVKEVSADKQYSSVNNLRVVEELGAVPYIPFKEGTTGASGGVWEKMYHYYEYRRAEFLEHYHLRSNAESTFMMVKTKFGDAVRSKTDMAMKNEVLTKFLCHNVCCVIQSMYELEIEPVFWGEKTKRA